jgi:tetratricopeptide (TPR) repeat protein
MSLGRLGDYEILERLGQGGMGVVFRARDTRPERLERIVALKVLSEALVDIPEFRSRLLREARTEAALSHVNIATCFEVGEASLEPRDLLEPGSSSPHPDRVPFLAMEFVPGEDLETRAGRETLSVPEIVGLGIQIASGLEVAHRAGVVHRDLKPANVRITPDGTAKILDFGLARVRAPDGTPLSGASTDSVSTERLLGTVPYMSPEQALQGRVDARSDLFSLGTLLYRLTTGRLPFEATGAQATLVAIIHLEPQPMARYAVGVPEELERIVRKLLAKRVEDRYQSAHEVMTDLSSLRDALSGAHAPAARRPAAPPSRLPARTAGIAVGAVALLAVAAALFARSGCAGWFEPASRNVLVMPFANATGDSTLDHVAAGFADEVMSDLVRRTGLNVMSREALTAERRALRAERVSEGPPLTEARAFGVGALLTGELRRRDGQQRLDLQLVSVRTRIVLWTGDYPWSYTDAARIRREVVDRVAERLSGGARRTAARAGVVPASANAYDAYLRGMRLLDDADDPLAPDRASEQFGRAIALDPEYAPAWAGRSKALFRLHARDHDQEALVSAEKAADEALRLDPDLLEGRVARAQILRGTGRSAEAITELRRALRINPNWDEAYLNLAALYRDAGDLVAAEKEIRRAVALRPDSWRNWNALGANLLRQGDRARAREAFQHIVDLEPRINRGYEQLAAVALLEGRYDDAIRVYRRLPTPVLDAALASNIANAYIGARRLADARDYLDLAVRLDPKNPLIRENLGDLLTHLDRPDEARAAYAEALRQVDDMLLDTPDRLELRVQRALYLAKSGDCAGAAGAFGALDREGMREAPELLYALARGRAACGLRAPALEALRLAIARGVAPQRPREDVEFIAMRGDPAFIRVAGAATGPTGPP